MRPAMPPPAPADKRPAPLVRIGELSRRTGVRTDTIRAWERRYGLLDPARSERGYRLYSADDEAALRAMRDLTAEGLAAAEAAAVVLAGANDMRPVATPSVLDPEIEADRLRTALEAFDEGAANAILDQALAGLSLELFAEGVVLRAMEAIGERWERGEVSVAQEHFASSLLRGRLLGLARGWGAGSGPLAVLACLPGELHDLGLISFGVALRELGWRIAFLGADTPIDTLRGAVEDLRPSAVVLSAAQPQLVRKVAPELRRLAGEVSLGLGGAGAASGPPIPGVFDLPHAPLAAARALADAVNAG